MSKSMEMLLVEKLVELENKVIKLEAENLMLKERIAQLNSHMFHDRG